MSNVVFTQNSIKKIDCYATNPPCPFLVECLTEFESDPIVSAVNNFEQT